MRSERGVRKFKAWCETQEEVDVFLKWLANKGMVFRQIYLREAIEKQRVNERTYKPPVGIIVDFPYKIMHTRNKAVFEMVDSRYYENMSKKIKDEIKKNDENSKRNNNNREG